VRRPPSLVAERAGDADADVVARLLALAGSRLAEQGFRNWLPPYPIERVRADVAEREVWLVRDEGEPVATYTLARTPARPYDPPPWPEPGAPALYLNRLAVDPVRQGAGIGAWCLDAVAVRAADAGARAVRCDVLRANAALCAFYERHGYVAHGERTHSGWTFACYEVAIAP
jgi:ribosomal protein S18 acetylase RimI-like enzyme